MTGLIQYEINANSDVLICDVGSNPNGTRTSASTTISQSATSSHSRYVILYSFEFFSEIQVKLANLPNISAKRKKKKLWMPSGHPS